MAKDVQVTAGRLVQDIMDAHSARLWSDLGWRLRLTMCITLITAGLVPLLTWLVPHLRQEEAFIRTVALYCYPITGACMCVTSAIMLVGIRRLVNKVPNVVTTEDAMLFNTVYDDVIVQKYEHPENINVEVLSRAHNRHP